MGIQQEVVGSPNAIKGPYRDEVEPNPVLVWDTIHGYQRSAALRAAIEIDLFTERSAPAPPMHAPSPRHAKRLSAA